MKLSTKSRYGIRSLLELALNYGNGPIRLKVIAKNQSLSTKYLEHLMAILKSAGLVDSVRGSKGGYALARKPSKIRLSQCFVVLEGEFIASDCLKTDVNCMMEPDCVMKNIWNELQDAINTVLDSKTLQDLVDMRKNSKGISYQI